MKALSRIVARAVTAVIGCVVVFDAYYVARSIATGGHAALTDVLVTPFAMLWQYPFVSAWYGLRFAWLFMSDHARVLASPTSLGFVQEHIGLLIKDVLLVLVLAAAIYFFEKRKSGALKEMIVFYAVVPSMIWFFWFYLIVL
jgi:hypothetical protein